VLYRCHESIPDACGTVDITEFIQGVVIFFTWHEFPPHEKL